MPDNELQTLLQKGLTESGAFKTTQVDTGNPDEAFKLEEASATKTETPATESAQEKPPAEQSSLNTEIKNENQGTEVKVETPVKSFEDLLSERSGGKFKDYAEIEKLINEPKVEFKSEAVKKFNDFASQFEDQEIATKLFFEHQTTDYEKIEDAEELIIRAEYAKNPEVDLDDIRALVNSKYRIDEWSKEDEPEHPWEKGTLAQMRVDALNAKKFLLAEREKTLSQYKKPDPEVIKKQELIEKQNWEKQVNEVMPTVEKINIKLSDKDVIDLKMTDEDKKFLKDAALKANVDAVSVFEDLAKDEKGNFSLKKHLENIYILKNFDKAVKTAIDSAKALGANQVAENIKNANFKTDGQVTEKVSTGPNGKIVSGSI